MKEILVTNKNIEIEQGEKVVVLGVDGNISPWCGCERKEDLSRAILQALEKCV